MNHWQRACKKYLGCELPTSPRFAKHAQTANIVYERFVAPISVFDFKYQLYLCAQQVKNISVEFLSMRSLIELIRATFPLSDREARTKLYHKPHRDLVKSKKKH